MNDLPKPPKVTEDQIEAVQKEQDVLRKKFTLPRDPQVSRALGIIKEVEAVPEELRSQFQLEDYAEALAFFGRFDEAAKYAKPEYYLSLHNIGTEDCGCFPMTVRAHENGKVITRTISHQFPLKEFVSTRGYTTILKCNKCGHLKCDDSR